MAAKTTKRTGGKKKATKKSPAQIEAAKQRRAEVMDRAATALANPQLGDRVNAALDAGATTALMNRFSLKNVGFMLEQGDAQGFEVTHVETYDKWKELGRQVTRGSIGLQVVEPYTYKVTKDQPGDDGETHEKRTGFKIGYRYDISQTHPAEGVEPVALPALDHRAERAAALVAKLEEQLERAGYTLAKSSDGPAADVDTDARTVTYHGDPADAGVLAALVAVSAAVLATEDRPAKGQSGPAAPAEAAPEPVAAPKPVELSLTF